MKKKILFGLIIILGVIILIFAKFKNSSSNKDDLVKVSLAEVAHSIFYAPQYVAISEGFFEDEGIDIDLKLANGADAVMAAVLSGDVDIGFCGTEATIYVDNFWKKKYIKNNANFGII